MDGLVPVGLPVHRDRRRPAAARPARLRAPAASASPRRAGLLCAWLQPWQGATFALVLAVAEAVAVRRGRAAGAAVRSLALPLAATAAPLVYYLAAVAARPLVGAGGPGQRPPALAVVGAGGRARAARRARPRSRTGCPAPDFAAVALRAWPFAALAVYFQPFGTFPFHALQGLALPLSVLAVLALRSWLGPRPLRAAPAVVAVVLLCAIGTAYRVSELADAVHLGRQPFFLTADERDALRHLERERRAGRRARAGLQRHRRAGLHRPRDVDRRRLVDAAAAGADAGGGGPVRRAARRRRGRGARAPLRRAVRVQRLPRPRRRRPRLLERVAEPPRRFGCATVWRVR